MSLDFGPDDIIHTDSSNVYGYVHRTDELLVIFKSGDVYRYSELDEKIIEMFEDAESKGSAVRSLLHGQIAEKVGNVFDLPSDAGNEEAS